MQISNVYQSVITLLLQNLFLYKLKLVENGHMNSQIDGKLRNLKNLVLMPEKATVLMKSRCSVLKFFFNSTFSGHIKGQTI